MILNEHNDENSESRLRFLGVVYMGQEEHQVHGAHVCGSLWTRDAREVGAGRGNETRVSMNSSMQVATGKSIMSNVALEEDLMKVYEDSFSFM